MMHGTTNIKRTAFATDIQLVLIIIAFIFMFSLLESTSIFENATVRVSTLRQRKLWEM